MRLLGTGDENSRGPHRIRPFVWRLQAADAPHPLVTKQLPQLSGLLQQRHSACVPVTLILLRISPEAHEQGCRQFGHATETEGQ